MIGAVSLLKLAPFFLMAVSPTSTNYTLKAYDFGNGGTDSSSSASFGLNGDSGLVSGDKSSSTNYGLNSGLNPTQNANAPAAPTLSNPNSRYDSLRVVLSTSGNPSDTKYLIAISSNNFATTYYVQPDLSVSSTYSITSYQTYTTWGGAAGADITGLPGGTTYEVKVRAIQGKFSESAFGPKSSAVATATPTFSMGITTTLTSTPPYAMNFSSLSAGTVFTANADVNLVLSTNALNGGAAYIKSQNSGLTSARAAFTITSATADLVTAQAGYGAQITSTGQTSGGPIIAPIPFNGSVDNVGQLSATFQPVITTAGLVSAGTATIRFKSKAAATTPAETDYSDVITIIGAMSY